MILEQSDLHFTCTEASRPATAGGEFSRQDDLAWGQRRQVFGQMARRNQELDSQNWLRTSTGAQA